MQRYQLHELLEAAKPFATKPDVQTWLEEKLRSIEAGKKNIRPQEVMEVSHDTLCEAIVELTHCPGAVVASICEKFEELGYQAIQN